MYGEWFESERVVELIFSTTTHTPLAVTDTTTTTTREPAAVQAILRGSTHTIDLGGAGRGGDLSESEREIEARRTLSVRLPDSSSMYVYDFRNTVRTRSARC